jgi:L-ascorbate metabolism protein UlaG (beta-lactamase superfamily)
VNDRSRVAARDPEWRSVRAAAPATTPGPEHARITFLGHSTVLIEVDELRVLTDPMLRDGLGPVRRQVEAILPELFADLDAVFISHGHHDHLDLPSLRKIPGRPTVLVPRGLGRVVGRAGLGPVEEVVEGDRLLIDRVHFEVVHAEHSGRREPLGPIAPALGCVVAGSAVVYFPGDTDLFPGMRRLADRVDVALLPVWGWGPVIGPGHLDPGRAAEAAALIGPRLAVPIHWGTLYPAGLRRIVPGPFDDPGPLFAAAMAERAPGVEVRVLRPGESLDVTPATA